MSYPAKVYFNEDEFSDALDELSRKFFGHTNWEFVKSGFNKEYYMFKFNVRPAKEELQ